MLLRPEPMKSRSAKVKNAKVTPRTLQGVKATVSRSSWSRLLPVTLLIVDHAPDALVAVEVDAVVREAVDPGGVFRPDELAKPEPSGVQEIAEIEGPQPDHSLLDLPAFGISADPQLTDSVAQSADLLSRRQRGGGIVAPGELLIGQVRR